MPIRKNTPFIRAALAVTATIGLAAVPASASAALFSFAKPAATPVPTATPAPSAGTAVNSTSAAVPAGSSCVQLPTTKAFQKVDGDTADYSLAPGGGFEQGAAGWTLANGAKVVTGNETLGVSSGTHALMLPLSASATSPSFCVDESNPSFRFAYKVDNASLSGFIAYVIYRDSAGAITNTQLVSSKGLTIAPSTWQASPKSPLATLIPLNSSAKTASVQLKITALNPTDFVQDTSEAIIGQNAATDLVHTVGSAGSNLVGTISGAVSPLLNIGVTIDSIAVDPYRRG